MSRRLLPLLALALLAAAPARANWIASGTFQYVDRIFDGNGFTGATANLPIRRAFVQVVDNGTGAVLATGGTDAAGNFSITVTDAQTRTVYVRALSYASDSTLYRLRVKNASSAIFAVAGPTVSGHAPATNVAFNGGSPMVAPRGSVGEAFNILDCLENGVDYQASLNGGVRPAVALTAYWSLTSTDGTYYTSNSIHLIADDGYSDTVINHEQGHFMAATFSADQNPGGTHYLGDNNQDLRLAWSEGWATYFGQSVRRYLGLSHPNWYADLLSESAAPGLNFSYELEGPGVSASGGASEISVQAALWDIADGAAAADDSPGTDDDPLTLPDSDIWDVFRNYLPTVPALSQSVTLEAFWDGWSARGWGHSTEMLATFLKEDIEYLPDSSENDNFAVLDRAVTATGAPSHHTFYGTGDADWARFLGVAGTTYVIETTGLSGGCDTQLRLYAADTTTLLSSNDNRAAGDLSSRIIYSPTSSGTFHVKCLRTAGYGRYGSYDLRVTQGTPSGAAFTDFTLTAGVGNYGNCRGVAWGDYNNDGYPDLYVCNLAAGNRLYRSNAGAGFTDVADAAGVQAGLSESHEGAAWGDYNNDGALDLAVVSADGLHLFRNGGSPGFVFSDVTSAAGLYFGGSGRTANWVDFDGDGWLDLYVANYGAASQLWRNNHNGTFSLQSRGVELNGESFTSAWTDFDGDGRPDLAVGLDDAVPAVRLFHQRPDGNFDDVTTAAGLGGATGRSFGLAWADFNADGAPDLLVVNETGQNLLYVNQGNLTFVESAERTGAVGGMSGASPAWADVDNDGDLDLYVVNLGYPAMMYDNLNGAGFTNSGLANTSVEARSVAAADFDRNGAVDFYVGSQSANVLYKGSALAGRHYLELRLTGRMSNRSAIGARVRIRAGSRRAWREVNGGQAWGSQPSMVLHFGLGSSTSVDTLLVKWPSGRVSFLTHVAADQLLDLDENAAATEVASAGPLALALHPNTPNPFTARTTIRFSLPAGPAAQRVRIELYDVGGRLERGLFDEKVPAGSQRSVTWDGLTDTGVPARSGVHFCRMAAGDRVLTRKLMLMR